MRDCHSIDSAQVLALARALVGACPGGREAAPALFTAPSIAGPAFVLAQSAIRSIPAWAQAIGAISLQHPLPAGESGGNLPALLIVWIEPGPAMTPGFPSQLALDLPAGRYSVSTYDAKKRLAVGSETAYGTPVVCGPPFDGAAVAVLVRPWPEPRLETPMASKTPTAALNGGEKP
jgi:hypothetical protein